jgi:hypothetical protein
MRNFHFADPASAAGKLGAPIITPGSGRPVSATTRPKDTISNTGPLQLKQWKLSSWDIIEAVSSRCWTAETAGLVRTLNEGAHTRRDESRTDPIIARRPLRAAPSRPRD